MSIYNLIDLFFFNFYPKSCSTCFANCIIISFQDEEGKCDLEYPKYTSADPAQGVYILSP